jgi:hypothetical protein
MLSRFRKSGFKGRQSLSKKVKREIKSAETGHYRYKACLKAILSPSRGPTPFPDRMRCVLRYSQPYTLLINNTGATGRQEFSMNSLFDPDFTGTGAQPGYFDQLSTLYNRYRVYGSAIKVIEVPFNAGTQINVPVTMVVVPSAQTLASYSTYDAAGLPRAQTRVCTGNMDSKNQTIVASHSVSEILGVKDVEGADRLQALVTASPSEQCLWSIIGRSVDSVTATTSEISVLITYDCEFFDRQVQLQSLEHKKRVQRAQESKNDAHQSGGPLAPGVTGIPVVEATDSKLDTTAIPLKGRYVVPMRRV